MVVAADIPLFHLECNSRHLAQRRCRHSLWQDLHRNSIMVVMLGDIVAVVILGKTAFFQEMQSSGGSQVH